ncbi:MAG TPA: Nramp family divalent metal transporter, partial [Myxococcaceae bacterium]|nr:Nramp family divalent metal transporter [Myxococcaceae bacterium]
GWTTHLGGWVRWGFLVYLLGWSFFTGGALISACGVAGTALLPLAEDADTSRRLWGVLHSVAGLALVLRGGFGLFERLMSACIGVMFVAVLATAALSGPDWGAAAQGLLVPTLPEGSTGWVLGLLGGVGGTVTLLVYGYWIREKERAGDEGLRLCRVDLGVGYVMTALFGLAMVLIGSRLELEGSGVRVAPLLARQLGELLGPPGRWLFLAGFWGAVFSSLLGVWQSVPYLFADFLRLRRGRGEREPSGAELRRSRAYRLYLVALAVVPLPMLWVSVKQAQLAYAVLGSLFMPLLALTLLLMNNRREWVGERFRNGWVTNALLVATLLLFGVVGYVEAAERIGQLLGN